MFILISSPDSYHPLNFLMSKVFLMDKQKMKTQKSK